MISNPTNNVHGERHPFEGDQTRLVNRGRMKFSKIDLSSGDELRLQKGQGLVEFSLLAVFLMILFVGAVQFGYAYFVGVALSDAAQEGAAEAGNKNEGK